jgi:periplasmic divalent cation tolerance protein
MRIALITAPGEKAQDLARRLVSERLCACVNVVPRVTSHYIWEGRQEADEESLLIAKLPAAQADAFVSRVKTLHPYSVPEVLLVEPTGGNEEYLDWVRGGGGQGDGEQGDGG